MHFKRFHGVVKQQQQQPKPSNYPRSPKQVPSMEYIFVAILSSFIQLAQKAVCLSV